MRTNNYVVEGITFVHIPFGLVVRMPGSHPGGPGSIPGMGSFKYVIFCMNLYIFCIQANISSWLLPTDLLLIVIQVEAKLTTVITDKRSGI